MRFPTIWIASLLWLAVSFPAVAEEPSLRTEYGLRTTPVESEAAATPNTKATPDPALLPPLMAMPESVAPVTPAESPARPAAPPDLPRGDASDPVRTTDTVPTLPTQEVESANAPVRTIDLTIAPDDIWDRVRNGYGMPDLNTELVQHWQAWYVSRPQMLQRIVERSRLYIHHIVEELERRGMPTELALLPMVESSYNPQALSSARASGIWQFIPKTGKSFGLKQNWWYDQRRDIVASTSAALDYLQYIYEMHGDWHLALASYNWGEGAVARALAKTAKRGLPGTYPNLNMPAETKNYVPKLQALKNIIANPRLFGLDILFIPNKPYFAQVKKPGNIDVSVAARLAEMPVEEFLALNPSYNRPLIPGSTEQPLVLPADKVDTFVTNLDAHDKPLSHWRQYTPKAGEKLETIAQRHGMSVSTLRAINGIGLRAKLKPGQALLVPTQGLSVADAEIDLSKFPATAQGNERIVVKNHTVKAGETLHSVAKRFKVDAEDIRSFNKLKSDALTLGQVLKIETVVAVKTPRKAAKGSKAAKAKGKPAKKVVVKKKQ